MNWYKALVTRESLRLFARAALTSLAYFISARLGVALLFQPQSIASFWPPSGLLVGVLARSRRRTWPMILLAVIPANIVANLLVGKSLAVSCAFALINCVANVIGVWLLIHFIGPCVRLTEMREVLGLIALPGIISTALSATLAAVVVTQGMGISSFWGVWYAWWAADALGILLISPVILTWPADGAIALHTFRPHRLAEIALLLAGMMSVAVFLFREEPLPTSMLLPLPYLTFPFLLWAAVRFGPQTTSAASLVLALVAIWYTAQGHGPFAVTGESVGDHVFSAQVFLSVSIITSLILAATLAERRRAEEALRTSEDRHRLLFERNLAGTFRSRRDGLILECNDAFVHLLGYTSRAEVLAHNARDFYRDAVDRGQLMTRLRPGFIINNHEMQWRRADGRPIWVMVNVRETGEGGLTYIDGIAIDITDRKQSEEARARLAAIVESSDDAIIGCTLEGSVFSWNTGAEKLYGYTSEEVKGRAIALLLPPDRLDELPFMLASIKRGERIGPYETVRQRKDGTLVDISLTMSPILDTVGNLLGSASIARDVSERKWAEEILIRRTEELDQANAELARSNMELEDFAYIASHDLKEPLRGLHNYSTFLLEDYGDVLDDEGRTKLATLVRLTQRMEVLIDSLLYYSRVGRVDLAIGEADLNKIVAGVVESLGISLQEAGVEVRIPAPLPTMRCDKARVGEIYRNLISNAMKYHDKPQKWIEIGCLEGQEPHPKPGDQSPRVFYVRDNGLGIPAKHHKAIFRIFKRLHARDKYGGGTGAGLTIVKKIVERHGGRIWLESILGEGTTFYFTLEKKGP